MAREPERAWLALAGQWWGARPSPALVALCLLLVAALALGGSSRPDIPALIVLRPVSLVLLGFGLWRLRWSHVRQQGSLFAIALAALALAMCHLIPLPPSVWTALPGHGLVAEIDRAAGLSDHWRPLSVAPSLTRNALAASALPLATLVLGAQLETRERHLLLPVLLAAGATSAAIGLGQGVSGGDVAQPLYNTSTEGSAVGLFANRNHQALLLAMLFPMLALCVADGPLFDRMGRVPGPARLVTIAAATFAGLCLVPLLLITGSRAGLILGVVGILAAALFVRIPARKRSKPFRSQKLLVAGSVCALFVFLVSAAYAAGRTEAFDRLRAGSIAEDLRWRALPDLLAMAGRYWPLGSGIGTFEKAYFVNEPDGLLGEAFLNHAHNDWLEVVITGGLPALVLLALSLTLFIAGCVRTARGWRLRDRLAEQNRLAGLGLVLVLLCAMASLTDYPLRVPALQYMFTIAVLWADGARRVPKPALQSIAAPQTI